MEPVVSIDRLTVVGGVEGSWNRGTRVASGDYRMVHDICESNAESVPGRYPYDYGYSFAGGGYVAFARQGAGIPAVRVDLNPNRLDADSAIRPLLAHLFDTRCTRFDVAVDYPHAVVGEWVPVGRSGKRFTVAARSGRVQTQMVGSRSSARQLVVYDKVADCRAKDEPVPWGFTGGDMMRVEARQRLKPSDGCGVLSPDLLDDVRLVAMGDEWSSHKVRDRALIEYVMRNPQARGELSPYYRKKLDTLLAVQGDSGAEFLPGIVYREARCALLETYFGLMGAGGGGEVLTAG